MNTQQEYEAQLRRDTNKFRKNLNGYFARQYKPFRMFIERSNNLTLIRASVPVYFNDEGLYPIYEKNYLEHGRKYYNHTIRRLEGAQKQFQLLPEGYDPNDPYVQAMNAFLVEEIGSRVVEVTAESQRIVSKVVNEVINEGLRQGWSVETTKRELLTKLDAKWIKSRKNRALTIARTEMLAASTHASYMGALSTGLEVKKVWRHGGAIPNRQARPDHLAMEGVSVGLNESFRLPSGALMQYPGDPNGGASEVIHCGCSITYEVD